MFLFYVLFALLFLQIMLGYVWLLGLSQSLWYYAYIKDTGEPPDLIIGPAWQRRLWQVRPKEVEALRGSLEEEHRLRVDAASYNNLGDRILVGLFVAWALAIIAASARRLLYAYFEYIQIS